MLHVAKHGARHSIQELEVETALTLNTEKDYRYMQKRLLFNLHLFHGKITVSALQQKCFFLIEKLGITKFFCFL
jgi:hypothetical protein